MITFTPLASSSLGNAYLLTDGETPLLLDAGITLMDIRKRLSFRIPKLAGVLITHEHMDHAKGVKHLMGTGRDAYMTQGTADALGMDKCKHRHRLNIIKALVQFNIGPWSVMPFDTAHDAAEPVGFLVGHESGDKILYATDTQYLKYRFNNLTHIAIECNHSRALLMDGACAGSFNSELAKRVRRNHMSLESVQKMLKSNDLSKLEEVHLLHASDNNSDVEHFKKEIQKQTGRPVYIADV